VNLVRSLYFHRVLSKSRPSIGELLKELLKTEQLSPEEIRELQLRKLRFLVEHSFSHVPFYRSRFRQAGLSPTDLTTLESLRNFPFLTKADIQQHQSNLITEGIDRAKLRRNHTGGSTGEPLTFYQDQNYQRAVSADLWRNLMWCGYTLGDRQVYLWGSDVDAKRYRGLKGHLRAYLQNLIWVDVFDLTEETLRRQLGEIARFRPKILVGYVSSLLLFARLLQKDRIRIPSLVAIQSSAEVLTSAHRQTLEETLGVKLFDRYGCRELGNIAHECEAHDGLHINAENNLVEFVDGQLVVTNLNNYAMPFIRYIIGDYGMAGKQERCACGRGLPRMSVVTGRFSNLIRSPGGKILHGEFFTHLFYGVPGVVQFQVVQETLQHLTIRIVKGKDFDPAFPAQLKEQILTHGDPRFSISIEYPDGIEPLRSGKFQFTISKISPLQEDRYVERHGRTAL
jgi:phenylacetate-CoA ligase